MRFNLDTLDIGSVLKAIGEDDFAQKGYYGECAKQMKGYEVDISKLLNKSISKKFIYESLVEKNLLKNVSYSSFYRWAKNIEKTASKDKNVSIKEHINTKNENKKSMLISNDSKDLFYGFDMNNQPDNLVNPVPVRSEISNESVCDIFVNDHTLTNDKIVRMLLCSISNIGINYFTNTWQYLLMLNDENENSYFERLQLLSNTNSLYEHEIFQATSQFQGYAIASQYFDLKPIKGQEETI
jgi:hypothetical protein